MLSWIKTLMEDAQKGREVRWQRRMAEAHRWAQRVADEGGRGVPLPKHRPSDSEQVVMRWESEEAAEHAVAKREGEGWTLWDAKASDIGNWPLVSLYYVKL